MPQGNASSRVGKEESEGMICIFALMWPLRSVKMSSVLLSVAAGDEADGKRIDAGSNALAVLSAATMCCSLNEEDGTMVPL